jgi:hypothetical protein
MDSVDTEGGAAAATLVRDALPHPVIEQATTRPRHAYVHRVVCSITGYFVRHRGVMDISTGIREQLVQRVIVWQRTCNKLQDLTTEGVAISGSAARQLSLKLSQKFQAVTMAIATAFARYRFIPRRLNCTFSSTVLSSRPPRQMS